MPPAMPVGIPVPPPQCGPTEDEKTMAMLCHLLGILTGFIGPLILWLVRKDTSRFIDFHGREALNFQITLFIAIFTLSILAMVLMFVFIGILLIPVIVGVAIFGLVVEILAAVAAQKGEWHRYPCCIRFV
jgi:uncharacterized Tic20 family protein